MAYPEALLDQANRLLLGGSGLPVGEAEVRRAISCAYYALFHLLVESATELLCPEQPPLLRRQFRRAFVHADMRSVCRQFESGHSRNMSAAMQHLFSDPIEPALLNVHMWTAPACEGVGCASGEMVRCSHMSGLSVRCL